MFSFLVFLSSGLFLGWSLGANDGANLFGTAVGTKMVKFRTAALISSIFVTLGAVIAGSGTTETINKLGHINAIAGAFMVVFAAALTIYWMTKARISVSTSQAIVGAIIGWNMYSAKPTDFSLLTTIAGTWIFCPILAAGFAVILYFFTKIALSIRCLKNKTGWLSVSQFSHELLYFACRIYCRIISFAYYKRYL